MNYKNIRNKFSILFQSIIKLKDDYSFFGKCLSFGYRSFYSLIFYIEKSLRLIKNRLQYGKLYFKKIYWIDPKKIQYLSKIRTNKWFDYGRIMEGDWDQSRIKFEETYIYRAFIERFKESKNWEDTEYYKKILEIYHYSREKIDEIFRELELLFYEIKNNGYKLKRELLSSKRLLVKYDIQTLLDEISVDINRDGQLLVLHGKNRLSIAKLLDIPKIPIVIIKRHQKWMLFRKNLIFYNKNYNNVNDDQFLAHPDLQNIPFNQGEIPYCLIRENISISKGKFLDIGAYLGYFCHKFEEEGFTCYAVEENQICVYLLKKLKKVENKKFTIIPGSILSYKKNQEIIFDVVLALSVFQNFLRSEKTYLDLINFLKRLKAKELIFGAQNPGEFENKHFYRNFNPEQFVNFILENSCFKKVKFIGKLKTGRYLYKLTSENFSS